VAKLTKYKILIAYISLIVIGIIGRYFSGENGNFWNVWSAIDTASAVALAVLAFFAYKQMIKDEDEITLYFKVDGILKDTGLKLLRKDCTRSEIIGIIGMMQRKTDKRFHYDPKYLKILVKEINLVQTAHKNSIEVPISKEEFEQFTL